MCPVTPHFDKFIRELKLMFYYCHMTPGACSPQSSVDLSRNWENCEYTGEKDQTLM